MPGLLAALAAVGAVACVETGEEPFSHGACAIRWDHMGEYADGPYFCLGDFTSSACDEGTSEFHTDRSCSSAGFTFCCETEFSKYQFRSREDAAWYDELSDPGGSYTDCADHPVACEDEGDDEPSPEGNDDGNADGCSSNSSCGSREKCQGGQCVSVECTSDSHCGSCSRCSDNVCRDCGSGPYGCYC